MPKAFDACVRGGGRVRTKSLSGNRYMHICFKRGHGYAGHVKTKRASSGQRHARKRA
jgi:hypothetical protein